MDFHSTDVWSINELDSWVERPEFLACPHGRYTLFCYRARMFFWQNFDIYFNDRKNTVTLIDIVIVFKKNSRSYHFFGAFTLSPFSVQISKSEARLSFSEKNTPRAKRFFSIS